MSGIPSQPVGYFCIGCFKLQAIVYRSSKAMHNSIVSASIGISCFDGKPPSNSDLYIFNGDIPSVTVAMPFSDLNFTAGVSSASLSTWASVFVHRLVPISCPLQGFIFECVKEIYCFYTDAFGFLCRFFG